ncbi:hypothetical protein [Alkalihalobacillus sp. BA299]|uniref:hypothetical protein n=1 Tax=Alkalihalobacillus sp. BA299 TaxID=2815938 RepID=UPI001ADD24E5|nr:hypothetical protein [Alkalihalobacillus sp. BA299]
MPKAEFISKKQLIDKLQSYGYDLFYDGTTDINKSVVYEIAINEGYRFEAALDLWETPIY